MMGKPVKHRPYRWVFQPRLSIAPGWNGQYQWHMTIPGAYGKRMAIVGGDMVASASLETELRWYFAWLGRCGYVPVRREEPCDPSA